jgi:dienelactone hydrolase
MPHVLRRLGLAFLLLCADARAAAPLAPANPWPAQRVAILRAFESVAGPFPDPTTAKRVPLDVRIEEETDRGSFLLRRITYQSEPGSRTPAYLCIPKAALTAAPGSVPAVLCLHPTDDEVGAGVTVGLSKKANRSYAAELAERGYITLAPAYPHLAGYAPDLAGLGYASGTMKAIWDNTRALDVLDSMPEVRRHAYGVIGHSLGGHNAIYTALFEPRLTVIVSSCGFDSYRDYYAGNPAVWVHGKGWCQDRYMPRLAQYAGRLAEIPFDFPDLLAALSPRPIYVNAPRRDSNFQWQSVDRVVAAARALAAAHGVNASLTVEHPDSEHDFPDAQRQAAYRLLDTVLKGKP